jgi:transposase/regulator of replication initiation timing
MSLSLDNISEVLSSLHSDLESLQNTISEQRIEISGLYRRLDRKDKEILELKRENKRLKERLSKYEEPTKDSHNSHIPPSKENIKSQQLRRTCSLREKSGKQSGGQQGHKGHTLELSSNPDTVHSHTRSYCRNCGRSLSGISPCLLEVRQVIDLPAVHPLTREHRTYSKLCSCGCLNKGSFPREARSRICYGTNLRALVSYLNTVQSIPYKRLCEILRDCFHVELSQGTIDNILESMKFSSQDVYEEIRSRVSHSSVVGADETGENVNGKLQWVWTWQTDKLTYLHQDKSRGKAAIGKQFPDGLAESILVTDRHASYFGMYVKGHQICLAHLLRELTYLCELDKKQDWSSRLMNLIKDAIHKRKTMIWENIPRKSLFDRLDELLNLSIHKLKEDFQRLQRSLLKHRDNIFRFLCNPNIPYDNNASERVMRIVKIKQKVSGCFRSEAGANTFTQLLSIADTAKKNGKSRFLALFEIANRG